MAQTQKKIRPKKKNPFDIEYGSETDRYKWTQNENEVTVTVPIPAGTKSKDIAVEIHSHTLACGLKGKPPIISVIHLLH